MSKKNKSVIQKFLALLGVQKILGNIFSFEKTFCRKKIGGCTMVFANIKKLAIFKIDMIKRCSSFECQCIQHESTNWGHYFFTSPTGDGTAILRGHLSHAKVQPFAGKRQYLTAKQSVVFSKSVKKSVKRDVRVLSA